MPNIIDDRGTGTGPDAPASSEQLARRRPIKRALPGDIVIEDCRTGTLAGLA